jgi:hypothetical protein
VYSKGSVAHLLILLELSLLSKMSCNGWFVNTHIVWASK